MQLELHNEKRKRVSKRTIHSKMISRYYAACISTYK